MRILHAFGLVLLVSSAACVGIVGGDDTSAAESEAAATPSVSLPLRRLSRKEITNTIGDLIAIALPAESDAVKAAVAPVLARLPDDAVVPAAGEARGGFRRVDQALQQGHADITYAVATAIGDQLTSSPARLEAAFGTCINESPNDACVTSFLKRFGERVLRRAVTDEDVAFYKTPLGGAQAVASSLADVVALLFTSPDLLYFVERAGGGDATARTLDAYELASRLSYHFWATLPDDELLAHARSGDLLRDDVYAKEVHRLAASDRARPMLDELFGEWLRLEELDRLDARVGEPVFDAFVKSDVPTAALRQNMFADVLDAAAWEARRGGSIADLLRNRRSFARTSDVAAIYGVPVWDGIGDPPEPPEPARAGLITRAAFLASGSANTRPIMKGLRVRMGLLCDKIPPPPPEAAATHVELSPTQTTREVVEALTQAPGTSCSGCHTSLINPIGFATEGFDALGRARKVQTLFDKFGNVIAERQVNTVTVPRIVPGDDRVANDARDVTRLLVESRKVEACFARHYFRFAFGRNETALDEPLIKALAEDAKAKSIAELLESVALRPEFKSKITIKEGT